MEDFMLNILSKIEVKALAAIITLCFLLYVIYKQFVDKLICTSIVLHNDTIQMQVSNKNILYPAYINKITISSHAYGIEYNENIDKYIDSKTPVNYSIYYDGVITEFDTICIEYILDGRSRKCIKKYPW